MRYSLVAKTDSEKDITIKIDDNRTIYNLDEIDLFTSNFEDNRELFYYIRKKYNVEVKSIFIKYKYKENDKLKEYSNDGYKKLDVIYGKTDLIDIIKSFHNDNLENEKINELQLSFMNKLSNKNNLIDIIDSNYVGKYLKRTIVDYMLDEIDIDKVIEVVEEHFKKYKSVRGIYILLNSDTFEYNHHKNK